ILCILNSKNYEARSEHIIITAISLGCLLIYFLLNYDLNRFLNKYKIYIEKKILRSLYEMLGITIYKVACDFLLFIAVFLKIYFGASDIFLFLILFQIILFLGYLGGLSGNKKKFIDRHKNKTPFAEGVIEGSESDFYGEFVKMFMDERTQNSETKRVKVDKLYEMYAEWSQMTGTLTLHKDIFIEKLMEFNYKVEEKNNTLYVQNISIDLLY
ncbi:MAG: hypothetical protein KAR20_12885, partial [Candidatus Heimdallarchaeota archaeon]|nr:hypothetical protein [Candidatus Heimdallarchaeota archaeon]